MTTTTILTVDYEKVADLEQFKRVCRFFADGIGATSYNVDFDHTVMKYLVTFHRIPNSVEMVLLPERKP